MTRRTHFWLRLVSIAIILAAEFGPRLWSAQPTASPVSVAAAGVR
jgi:hypothetical protein